MGNYILTQQDLMDELIIQINFLKNSCKIYDEGIEEEAKRIAANIRILFHETGSSKALFYQLKMEDSIYILSTASRFSPGNLLTSSCLLKILINGQNVEYRPMGDIQEYEHYFLCIEDWWNEIIFDDKHNVYTRKDIVLFIANKDGGAHIDPCLDEQYANLLKFNSLKWVNSQGKKLKNNPIYAALRQMAYEIIFSFDIFHETMQQERKLYKEEIDVRLFKNQKRFLYHKGKEIYTDVTLKQISNLQRESRNLYRRKYGQSEYFFVHKRG